MATIPDLQPHHVCTGCGKAGLTWTGYWSHLQQSKNSNCTAIFKKLSMDTNTGSDSDSEPDISEMEDEEARIMPFTGNALGTAMQYRDDDFGQQSDDNNLQNDVIAAEMEDLKQRLVDAELEDGWEPARAPPTVLSHLEEDENENDDDAINIQQRQTTEERADCHPRIVRYSDTYPSARCGVVIRAWHG